ncbi:MAG: FHA domain-containing protein [Lachnospira sp.]
MYTLKDNGVITEITCGNNFEYILKDNTTFVNTDYKVLQSQNNGIFVKCMKMTRNGWIDLYYVTDEYRPMASMFVGINADTLVNVVVNLFASVIEVRNNGFLACQCIDLSWDKIFVEQNTLKVKLVYLPLSVKVFDSYSEFESELRSSIVKLANKVISTSSARLDQFILDLCNGSLTLEDVYNKSRGAGTTPIIKHDNPVSQLPTSGNPRGIKLVAMNAPNYFELVIDRPDVVIGKKQELVDLVIPFNKMISRKHCRVSNMNGIYYINDEGSANGTFVNGVRLNPGQKIKINRGDVIRMANSDFQVV